MKKITTFTALCCTLLVVGVAHSQSPALAPGAKYVSLGSSFAAGPGVPEPLGACGRSDHNYSHIVAAELNLAQTDVSCNGATIDNIRNTPQNGAPPQIDAVTSDTALVTFTIGGNDINYTSSTYACSGTAPDEHCSANLNQSAINEAVDGLSAELGAMIDEIRAKAPQALIVLVNYPRVFPTDATNCSELELSPEDTIYLAKLGQKLQDTFVSVASSKRILIADAYVRAAGHGPCATPAERWVNGASVAIDGIRYHPTAEGHREMAQLLLSALGRG